MKGSSSIHILAKDKSEPHEKGRGPKYLNNPLPPSGDTAWGSSDRGRAGTKTRSARRDLGTSNSVFPPHQMSVPDNFAIKTIENETKLYHLLPDSY